jgi:DNA-binding Xre family transcriptional regulator
MNIIYPNLNAKLIERGLSLKDLSDILGVNEAVIEKKMQGQLPWKLAEAVKICVYLKFPDANFLFVQLDTNT